MDQNSNEVKELIHTFDNGNPKDNMILIITQLFQLAKRYNLWEDEEWKILSGFGSRTISGRAAKAWYDKIEIARTRRAGTTTAKAIQESNSRVWKAVLGKKGCQGPERQNQRSA